MKQLGQFPLPVEIVAFACKHTLKKFEQAGYSATIREKDGTLFVTDGGNCIVDLHLGMIEDPIGLAESIGRMTGVVDHGLFIGLVHEVLLAENGNVRIWKKGEHPISG